jgi:hypothetical protein
VVTADPRAHRRPDGDSEMTPSHPAPISRVELLEMEHSRVMAQTAGLKDQIRTLKKLLWREAMRHRRAHRYRNAVDIEVALQRMDG